MFFLRISAVWAFCELSLGLPSSLAGFTMFPDVHRNLDVITLDCYFGPLAGDANIGPFRRFTKRYDHLQRQSDENSINRIVAYSP